MSLDFTHKPNYFMHAQQIMHHIKNYIEKHPNQNPIHFRLEDIYALFRQDFASATTNLEGIMNIVDEYKVETLNGDRKIIQHYQIDAKENTISIHFNEDALTSLSAGKNFLSPDATLQG